MTSPRSVLLFSVAATVTLAGCPTSYPEGFYPCHTATDCPPHWYCHTDLLCWSHEEVPDAGRDGGVGDASLDAGRDTGTDAAVGIDAWIGTDTGSADDAWTGDDAWTPDDAGTDAFVGDDAWVGNDGGVLPIDVGVDGCVLSTYYVDGDGDGYGGGTTVQACALPGGYAATGGDCNDGNGAIHPTAAEVCNGMDDDCSGHADDGGALQCVQSQPTVCTTTCGSTGTGLCSASCTLPSAATCSPPTSETVCDGRDDNCNGVADEGLGDIGAPVMGLPFGPYTGVQLVSTATGYMLFARGLDLAGHLAMQLLDSAGVPVGSSIPLAMTITSNGTFAASSAGSNFIIAANGRVSTVNATGGLLMDGPLPVPAGFNSTARMTIADADATNATIYAGFCSSVDPFPCSLIRRFRVNLTAATPTVVSATDAATDAASVEPFDAVATTAGDYLAYENSSGAIRLVVISGTGAVTALGAIATAAPNDIAVAIASSSVPIGPANPLAIVWQDVFTSPMATTHLVEVRGVSPLTVGTAIALQGGIGGPAGSSRSVDVVSAPDDSPGVHSGHWWVASSQWNGVNTIEMAWEVVGNGGTPTSPTRTLSSPQGALGPVSVAVGPSGSVRFAHSPSTRVAVTRQLGCR